MPCITCENTQVVMNDYLALVMNLIKRFSSIVSDISFDINCYLNCTSAWLLDLFLHRMQA